MKKLFDNFEEFVGGSLFIGMFIVLVMQIFSRQFLNQPLVWSEELAKLIFIYVGLFGVTACIKDNSHVAIDFFVQKLPPAFQKGIHVFNQVLILATLVTIFIISIRITGRQAPIDIVSLRISYIYMYIALPIFSLLMIFRQIHRNVKEFSIWRKTKSGVM
ncbi:TRAP transporter small permease [Alteribacter populi]|uniref:TRAP transporter small permease n=1 Tax=Alteribacter populi TaxID=2011011 RepID=UPI000C2C952C|nr:TRAP transporter small permease [Alteribacter populi]